MFVEKLTESEETLALKNMYEENKKNIEERHLYLSMFSDENRIRRFNPFLFKTEEFFISLSIQAGSTYYSLPKLTLENPRKYTHFEMALLINGSFSSVIEAFPEFDKNNEFDDFYDGSIYSYVPTELVSDLYEFLNKKYNQNEVNGFED